MTERMLADQRVPGIPGKALRAYAALSTAVIKSDRSVGNLTETVIKDPNKQEKAVAALNLIGKVLPKAELFVYDSITNTRTLPLGGTGAYPNFGNGENIIFVRTNGGNSTTDWVAKINKVFVGKTVRGLQEAAASACSEYKLVKSWFRGTDLEIPTEHTIIGHSHLKNPSDIFRKQQQKNNLPTLITLQRYVPGTFEGIFENYHTTDSLARRLKGTSLIRSWGIIASRIVEAYDKEGKTPDIMGLNNFAIRHDPENTGLLHIDPHMVQSPQLVRSGNREGEYNRRIEFLRESASQFTS